MKAIIVQGCKDCPYSMAGAWGGECSKFAQMPISQSEDREDWPDTPHPDCKLNDLPTQKEIHKGIEDSCNTLQGSKETRESRTSLNEAKKWNGIGFVDGANWLIQQISK